MAKRRDEMERLRDLSSEDLNDEAIRLKESLFRSRFKLSLGDMDAVKRIRGERRQIARIQTMLNQRTREQAAS